MSSPPDYWPSPPPGGWTSEDLDRLPPEGPHGEPDFFKHVELIDGALVLASPRRRFHESVGFGLRVVLNAQAPGNLKAMTHMDVRLGPRTRPCPDVLVVDALAAADRDRTCYTPDEVHLVVEVVSPESVDRDRDLKPRKYAAAGIPHFWRVEESDGSPNVYVYELDPATATYALTGISHGRLKVAVPFPIDIDLENLPD
ncbi:Uma2 family endonuclease [Thermopolyspora sp. NPDC052614]|uniref:Uma2 family endonuclease n=1 Tax=Thermopolyspora sp. NPDC052614 TaxID=3155682 RepID=UPI0034291B19